MKRADDEPMQASRTQYHVEIGRPGKRTKRVVNAAANRPWCLAVLTTLATLAAGVSVIVMADFGQPFWAYAPLLLWLGTFGLPTTLGVFAVAACWGRMPGLYGLLPFAATAAVVGFVFQAAFLHSCAKLLRRRQR